MVNVQPKNSKLHRSRAADHRPGRGSRVRTGGRIAGRSAGSSVRTAIVMGKLGLSREQAERAPGAGRRKDFEKLSMDKFVIKGGAPLKGEIPTSGSKNSALPALAAALLTDEPVILHRIPRVRDIRTMQRLLVDIGAERGGGRRDHAAAHAERSSARKRPTSW